MVVVQASPRRVVMLPAEPTEHPERLPGPTYIQDPPRELRLLSKVRVKNWEHRLSRPADSLASPLRIHDGTLAATMMATKYTLVRHLSLVYETLGMLAQPVRSRDMGPSERRRPITVVTADPPRVTVFGSGRVDPMISMATPMGTPVMVELLKLTPEMKIYFLHELPVIVLQEHNAPPFIRHAAREQYTEFRDYQRAARMASHFCELTEKLAKIVRAMSDSNPVPLVKIAFNTSAVKVRQLTDALFEVQICTELPDVKFVPTSECREWPPVVSAHLSNHTQWVIKPETLEIVEASRHVNNCASNKTMHWNESFVQLDYHTGLLHPFKVQQQASRSVKILEDEMIIQNWELASGDVTMRQLIVDMHQAAQVQRQLGPIRRSSNPQKIEDEIDEFLIPWWVWKILDATWRCIVTLVVAVNIVQFIRWVKAVSAPIREPDTRRPRERFQQRRTPDGRPLDFWGSPSNV